jgi:hypothetical protein
MVSGCPKGHEQLFRKDSLSREDAFFDVEEREEVPMGHKLLRKELMGCAVLHPSYGSFHGFRVSLRDVKSCYEKATHKGLDYGSVRRLFMVWGVPQGHEVPRWMIVLHGTPDIFTPENYRDQD